MNSNKTIRLTLVLCSLVMAGAAGAQQTVPIPATEIDKAACTDFNWNADMKREHPRLAAACQDVVVYNGAKWARFAADFKGMDRDGKVNFNIRDKTRNDRSITDVKFAPRPGQVVYMDSGTIPFDQLKSTDVVNLYVPENRYGFSAQPGAETEELALVVPKARVEPRPAPVTAVASRDAPPAMLPQTASKIPFLALGGLLSLFGGLALTLRRFR